MKRHLLLLVLTLWTGLTTFGQTAVTVQNPSFEDATNGWVLNNMTRQSNSYFTKKDDSHYLQNFSARGTKIKDGSAVQRLHDINAGKYRLTVNACHVQQDKTGSDVNNSETPQTGAYVFAGYYSKEVSTSDTYSLDFVVIGNDYVDIGAKSVSATGNFFAVDNFIVEYLGEASLNDYKDVLTMLVNEAQTYANSSTTALNTAINAAQAAINDENATTETIVSAYTNLQQAYNNAFANAKIVNPSFEDGTNGWTVSNMSQQSNSVFSRKKGTYYMESWVGRGSKLGNAQVCQTISGLSEGNYKLTAYALHIQQSGDGSTTNTGSAQKGAYLYAGTGKTAVTAMKLYNVEFTVVEGQKDVEIGLKAKDATGNYLCVDYFQLYYTGEATLADYAKMVQGLIEQAQEYLDMGIQNSVASTVQKAIDNANTAIQGTGTDDNGNIVYDKSALLNAKAQLEAEIVKAKESRQLYDNLQVRIDYAEKVLGWWDGDTRKANAITQLKEYIATAKERMTDYSLSKIRLNSTVNTLNTRIAAVDKKIYASNSACGTEEQLQKSNSQWCYERSLQSKHWILFWEAGYGTEVPAAVPEILENADKIFEFYANELKFININQGKSKTDTYKMIIRLRETSEWEASGSGIDDQIGLLTLSRWAYTSRGGQTVAHEIGHCFQYQTHCDNGNWNGWMYTWENSGNGNVFWEMCAQWQAYKFYPSMQFDNEWLNGTLNGLHKNPLCEELRYNNYFIQDYFVDQHGLDIIGRLWNESKNPEDPFQAYMRITMDNGMTAAEKLEQFNNEMWLYGAKMTTFDMEGIRKAGSNTIGVRSQTALTKDTEGYWMPNASNCVETFGNNAIQVNVPSTAKRIYAEFTGLTSQKGYISYKPNKYGWKFGFVALKKDGTRVYGDVETATASNPDGLVEFDCPANCSRVWLVVSGAPTEYWSRGWNGTTDDDEQMPYKVKFYQTNVYGNANNNSYPVGIEDIAVDTLRPTDNNVYTLSGQIVRQGSTSIEGLPKGIYIVGGKKVIQ